MAFIPDHRSEEIRRLFTMLYAVLTQSGGRNSVLALDLEKAKHEIEQGGTVEMYATPENPYENNIRVIRPKPKQPKPQTGYIFVEDPILTSSTPPKQPQQETDKKGPSYYG